MSHRLAPVAKLGLGILAGILFALAPLAGLALRQAPRSYASALAYYVAPAGSDTNPGTATAPFRTIAHAAGLAAPGVVVHVEPGTYTYNKLTTGASGTATARIVYVSDKKWGAKIVGTGYDRTWENTGNYVDIIGFDITNTYSEGRLGLINYGSYVRVIGNHVHDISTNWCDPRYGGAGIDNANFSTGSNDDVIGNVIDHVGPMGDSCADQVQGIYHSVAGGHIENNIVHNISGFGIHLWHAASNVVIANNLAFGCGQAGIIVAGGDSPGQTTQYAVNRGTIVVNNIAMDNQRYGIREYGNVSGATYAFNDVYRNSVGAYYFVGGDTATHGLAADPQFVNFRLNGGGDYDLRPSSPLIDAGTGMDAPSTDFDGNARPQRNGFDVGPYEFASSGSPTPSIPAPAAVTPGNVTQPSRDSKTFDTDFAALLANASVPIIVVTLLATASGALTWHLRKRRKRW
jgi:parallel beta-helix repeat protein